MRQIITVGLVLLGFMVSCGIQKKTEKTNVQEEKELSEKEKREYYYALTEATKQKLFGNLREAASNYRNCIRVNPESAVSYYEMANILLMAGNGEEAERYSKKAGELDPENFWYKRQLIQIYKMNNKKEKAVRLLEELSKKNPDNPEMKFELAGLYDETGKTGQALKYLNMLEKQFGISEPVILAKEKIYQRNGEYKKAEEELLKLINIFDEEIRYLGMLAELYGDSGNKEKALETYERIFELEPENGMARLSLAEFYKTQGEQKKYKETIIEAFQSKDLSIDHKIEEIVLFFRNEREFKDKQDLIRQLIGILMKNHGKNLKVRTIYADFLTKTGKYNEAREEFAYILERQKGNYLIWEQAIYVDNILGNTEAVYEKSREAMKYFQRQPMLFLFRGMSALQKGNAKEAIEVLNEGLEYVGEQEELLVQFYNFIAEAFRDQGEMEKSFRYFEKVLEIEPDNKMVLNNYGYYLALEEEELDKALKYSEKTIKSEPENSTYLDTYAWILFKMGNLREARKYIEKAVEHGGGEDPEILEHYGDILYVQGERDEAVKIWRKAVEAGNESIDMEKKLENE